ncbi:MAG: hypothetical protein FJY10_03525 [Bacteroidetes bacterium]|nr:hypothetical protein [Bacteroidota bacterium]
MNTKEIYGLIKKYFDGETTLEEEQQLRTFFSQEDVPEELVAFKELFGYYHASAEESLDDTFEKSIMAQIEKDVIKPIGFNRKKMYSIMGIAAGILILIGVLFYTDFFQSFQTDSSGSDAESEMAYLQTKQALLLISTSLNKGLDQASKLSAFNKGVEHMNKLSAFYQCETKVLHPNTLDK